MIDYRFGDLLQEARYIERPLVITTNGFVKRNGEAVMGAGIAKQIRDSIPGVALRLGQLIEAHGNRPFRLSPDLWTLPVKHAWSEPADRLLIGESLGLMRSMVRKFAPLSLMFPRPGCGNGRLDWTLDGIEELMQLFAEDVSPVRVEVWDWAPVVREQAKEV